MLARAGLVLSTSTVRRMLTRTIPRPERPEPRAKAPPEAIEATPSAGVPTAFGFWVPWLPFALPLRWPFGAWVAVVLDHFTRRVVTRGIFTKEPTAP